MTWELLKVGLLLAALIVVPGALIAWLIHRISISDAGSYIASVICSPDDD